MLKTSTFGRGLVLVTIFLLASSAVQACDDCGRRCDKRKTKGDVKSLKATLDWRDGQWCLWIRYKLEIKNARACDAFDLVLTPTECGRALADRDGQPLSLALSLPASGTRCDNKIKLRNEVTMILPEGSIGDPYRVRVCAELIDLRRNKLLDDKSTKAKVCGVPCEVVVVNVRYETHYDVYPPPLPTVVYVEPVPVIYTPPVVTYHYSHGFWPAYDCGPWFYGGRSFGFHSRVGWGRGWGRGGFWGW